MNNISFKARIFGLNNSSVKDDFEKKTMNDYQHAIRIFKDKDTGLDIFIMSKEGTPSVKYLNILNSPKNGEYKLEQLLKIFKILKIKEAQNIVTQRKRNKIENDFVNELKEFIKEKELEEQQKKKTIVKIVENNDKISSNDTESILQNIKELD